MAWMLMKNALLNHVVNENVIAAIYLIAKIMNISRGTLYRYVGKGKRKQSCHLSDKISHLT